MRLCLEEFVLTEFGKRGEKGAHICGLGLVVINLLLDMMFVWMDRVLWSYSDFFWALNDISHDLGLWSFGSKWLYQNLGLKFISI